MAVPFQGSPREWFLANTEENRGIVCSQKRPCDKLLLLRCCYRGLNLGLVAVDHHSSRIHLYFKIVWRGSFAQDSTPKGSVYGSAC
jgi:hypothetical protein